MQSGLSASDAVARLIAQSRFTDYRQVLAVDRAGGTAIHSAPNSLGIWTQAMGENVASGGNLLANDTIPQAVVDGFQTTSGRLGDRLIAAMRAGLAAGGEAGPVRSAGRARGAFCHSVISADRLAAARRRTSTCKIASCMASL